MRNYYLFIIATFLSFIAGCRSARTFQIECYSTTSDAVFTVDVLVESRTGSPDIGAVKLDAIDGILFRGLTGNNCITQKPMINRAKAEVSDNQLLRGMYGSSKGYEKYITGINRVGMNSIPSSGTSVSQIRYRVTVNKELLRKDLVNAGLASNLSAGF